MNKVDTSILSGNYKIDGLVQVTDGVIVDNPFSLSVGDCLASKWLLDNKDLSLVKIREAMKEQGLGTYEVDECFDYAVYYFLAKKERDFNPEYFGNEASDTYSLKIYCLYQLKIIVYEYRNEMRTRAKNTVHLMTVDKDDTDNMPRNGISYDVVSKMSFDDEKENFGFNDIIEFEELQQIFDIEIPYYNEEFKLLGMKNFDFKAYVYHMFLSNKAISLDGSQLSDDSLKSVAEALGVTPSWLKRVNKVIKDSMKSRKDLFKDLPELISQLIQGKLKGWKPKFDN